MSEQGCSQVKVTRWMRFKWQASHRSWWYTMPIASRLHAWTRWTQEPTPKGWNRDARWGRWARRWLGGLNVACWTHVCGHGLVYSFRVGCIYWAPRYAKRVLNLR